MQNNANNYTGKNKSDDNDGDDVDVDDDDGDGNGNGNGDDCNSTNGEMTTRAGDVLPLLENARKRKAISFRNALTNGSGRAQKLYISLFPTASHLITLF